MLDSAIADNDSDAHTGPLIKNSVALCRGITILKSWSAECKTAVMLSCLFDFVA